MSSGTSRKLDLVFWIVALAFWMSFIGKMLVESEIIGDINTLSLGIHVGMFLTRWVAERPDPGAPKLILPSGTQEREIVYNEYPDI